MELQTNGAVTKTDAAKEITKNVAKTGVAKDAPATEKPKADNPAASKQEPAKPEPAKQPDQTKAETQPAKPELSLDDKLKMVSDLHRKSVQRLNLLSRIQQLEQFEITLAQQNDELEDNLYQGCKLIIRDDKNREFVTTTPGLIRLVSQFIFNACNQKLAEIEATINFPKI